MARGGNNIALSAAAFFPVSERLSKSRPWLLIALVWALTRAVPLSQLVPETFWEVAEAKKQLEYGFVATKGAIINVHYMSGRVAEPAKFNYVNHPYPILWADTLARWLGGPWGVVAFNALLGLAGCLAAFAALRRFYAERESFWGAMIFTLAPVNVLFNVNPDQSGLAAIFWPFAVWALARARELPTAGRAWLLGAVVFLSGQVSWSPYSFYPVLLLGALGVVWERGRGFSWEPRPALVKAVVLGAALTVAVFVAQIICYTPDWSDLTGYIGRQAGAESGVGLLQMYVGIGLRAALSAGPALLLGTLAWLWLSPRWPRLDWLRLGAFCYPLLYALCALALRRYFFRERHLYCYLTFPLLILTMETLRQWPGRLWRTTLAVLSVAALAYPLFQATIPVVSQTTLLLSREVQALSQPEQVIATNLLPQQFPFPTWDVGSTGLLGLMADRNLRDSIASREQLEALPAAFKTPRLEILYVLDPARPIDDALRQTLQGARPVRDWTFAVPEEPPSLALRARSLYWKLAGKHQTAAGAGRVPEMTLRFFRLTAESGADGTTTFALPTPP